MLETMKALLRSQDFCVLATASEEGPHCSLMGYIASEDGRTVYLVTRRGTRKYANLEARPDVSLLVDTRAGAAEAETVRALTVKGRFEPFGEGEEAARDAVRERFARAHPGLASILDAPDAALLRVRVVAFQLLDGPTDESFVEF